MRFYNQQHRFYCGVDLHARTLSLHVLDAAGTTRLAKTLPANPDAFLKAVAPFRDGLVVACECMFAWYWLADLCTAEGIPFVLGHALYLKAIHGGKAKTDQIDAYKIAVLLRGGMLPQAYVYPKGMRATRDLRRRRTFFVRRRAEALVHLTNTNSQYNLPPFPKKLAYAANREGLGLPERFADPSVRQDVELDLALLDTCDAQIRAVALYLTRAAKVDDPQAYARLLRRTPWSARRVAALLSSQDRTGPPAEDEPRVLKGRPGGTDEFLGRGLAVPQSPCLSGRGGLPLDKCLVQLHADATIRKYLAAANEAVNSGPVITPRKKNCSSPVRRAPVDRRGDIRVRRLRESVNLR
jgi:hypothetical protein